LVRAGVLGLLAGTGSTFLLGTHADVSMAAAVLLGANMGVMFTGAMLRRATYTRSRTLAALNHADRRAVRRAVRESGLVDPRLAPAVVAEADEMARVRRFPAWLLPTLTVLGAVFAACAGVLDAVLAPSPLMVLAAFCVVVDMCVLPVVVREPTRFANAQLARKYALAAHHG
jgi:hypothetical protein